MTISRIATYLLYLLLLISVVFIGWFFFGGFVAGTEGTNFAEPLVTDKILLWAFILLIIAAAAALIFPLVFMIMNPKNALKTLIILVGIAVLILIAWLMASDQVLNLINYNGPDNVPAVLKRADTEIIVTYILAGIAVILILYTEIAKLFK
jgi:hypothetical protein